MYHIVFGFLYLLSLLPWKVLYVISDGLYFIVYYLIGYRKEVVLSNLMIAFPGKTDAERLRIAKDFYHQFIDTFIETIKLLSASEGDIRKRLSVNAEVLNNLYDTGKNVQILSAHFFNWEFGNLAMSLISRYPFIVVYMPVKSNISDRLILRLRQRFGGIMVPATSFRRSFRPYARERYALTLVADQNPGSPAHAYWLPFFGKMVPFLKGPEKGAKSSNDAVIFAHFYRERRGYYNVEFKLLTTEPRSYIEGALTRELVRLTEEAIHRKPANYLWSHRRWKWEYTDEYKHLVIVPQDDNAGS